MELFVAVLRLNISSDNLFLTYLFRKSSLKTASVSPRLSRKLSNNLRLMDLRFLLDTGFIFQYYYYYYYYISNSTDYLIDEKIELEIDTFYLGVREVGGDHGDGLG